MDVWKEDEPVQQKKERAFLGNRLRGNTRSGARKGCSLWFRCWRSQTALRPRHPTTLVCLREVRPRSRPRLLLRPLQRSLLPLPHTPATASVSQVTWFEGVSCFFRPSITSLANSPAAPPPAPEMERSQRARGRALPRDPRKFGNTSDR